MFLSELDIMQIYHSLTRSYFIYGLAVWGNTFPTYISKLHILQNKTIRIVIGSSWNETVTHLYQNFKILLSPSLFRFSGAKLFTSLVDCVFLFNLITISLYLNAYTLALHDSHLL